jgi:4-hydroxy-tetrahydrodipicolinate synthase
MSANLFSGTGIAMITPFDANGNIDWNSLKNVVRFLIAGKVEYLVVMGTTGENVTISKEENRRYFHLSPTQSCRVTTGGRCWRQQYRRSN